MIIQTIRKTYGIKIPNLRIVLFFSALAALLSIASFPITSAFSADQTSAGPPVAAFAFIKNGSIPQSPEAFSYKFPRDESEPWKGKRPWLEITKEMKDWTYAGVFTNMTVVDNPKGFYLMDLYLHGDATKNTPMLKIANLDLRKFLPDPIPNKHSCVARIQAYLGIYNRKSRSVIATIKGEHAAHSNISQVDVINNCREPGNWEFNVFETVNGTKKKVLHGYFFVPVDYLNARFKKYTGYAWRDAGAGLRFPRHPARPSEPNAKLPSTRISWLKAKPINLAEEIKGGDLAMMWWAMPKFPAYCNIRDLKSVFPTLPSTGGDGEDGKWVAPETKKLTVVTGPIDYSVFPSETRGKSGIAKKKDGTPVRQTLSFVETHACGTTPLKADEVPEGFAWPLDKDNPNRAELARSKWKNQCAFVPHTFRNWEDIKKYRVRLSGFEGDGTYGCAVKGKTAEEKLAHRKDKLKDNLNCWKFGYEKYINDFTGYRLARKSGFTEILLVNTSKSRFLRRGLGRSVVIGFDDAKLKVAGKEGLYYLLGFNSKKLSAPYEEVDVDKARPHYAYILDQKGNIKDHYGVSNLFRDGVGVGQVQMRLEGSGGNQKLIVTLMSHERIMPLTQFKIAYPELKKTDGQVFQDFSISAVQNIDDANPEEALKKRVASYKPGNGEEIIADAVLSHGMTYHAVILKTDDGPVVRRYMAGGSRPAEADIALIESDGKYVEQDNDYGEFFRINGDVLEFHDFNGLVVKEPIVRRTKK